MKTTTSDAAGIRMEFNRREALGLLGAAGVAAITGCGTQTAGGLGGTSNSNTASGSNANTDPSTLSCIVTPALTEGPYFVDEMLNRSDIRSDPTTGAVQDGVPLRLRLLVAQVTGSTCAPLAGAQVDVWHCNSQGLYSDQPANGTSGQKFLRGFQVTDADGAVEFTTIYPGWYMGRAVHIHYKVRSGSREFTSQLFFDEAVSAQVFSQQPYSPRGLPDTSNARDGIFRQETLLTLANEGEGYLGSFNVGFRIS